MSLSILTLICLLLAAIAFGLSFTIRANSNATPIRSFGCLIFVFIACFVGLYARGSSDKNRTNAPAFEDVYLEQTDQPTSTTTVQDPSSSTPLFPSSTYPVYK